eukprot:Anaeramoba_ignava/a218717_19.p1 GENE.a218717_19~~a218717_19.p1  ORF type:complete len:191 (+),score=58.62 a218717_19:1293-1865(+)
MENLFYGHKIWKVFDLKGSTRSRYINPNKKDPNSPIPSTTGNQLAHSNSMSNNHSQFFTSQSPVLLDINLIDFIYGSPLFCNEKDKSILMVYILNDSLFLSRRNIMDYSLLVGIDQETGELVCGIIDYLRKFTWDKHLESWVKKSTLIGKKGTPTIISPEQYKNRFREAMKKYFVAVPSKFDFPKKKNLK